MATKRYIPVDALRAIAGGSYEETIAALGEMAQSRAAELFGEDMPVSIIGTFPTVALVLSESGQVARMFYDRGSDGSPQYSKSEQVEVPVLVGETAEDFARGLIREAVVAWREGRVEEAQKAISAAAPYIADRPKLDEQKVVEVSEAALRADRPWRSLLAGGTTALGAEGSFIEDAAISREEWSPLEGLQPKFSLLYSGEIAESDLQEYRSTVLAAYEDAHGKFEKCSKELTDCYVAASRATASDLEDPGVVLFKRFAEDLLSDLASRCRVLRESRKTLARIYGLGRLYDAVVEDVNVCETACRFVRGMCERLTGAGP